MATKSTKTSANRGATQRKNGTSKATTNRSKPRTTRSTRKTWNLTEAQMQAASNSQAIIEFELDGTIITANDNFLKAMGYSLEEIQGKHHRIFVDPDHAKSEEYRNLWERLGRGESLSGEYRRLTKDGEDIWIQASYNPLFDFAGKPCRVIKFAVDISEQKFRNADYEEQLAAIRKSQAVIEFDLDGNILDANDNFLATVGYSLEEIRGRHHRLFVGEEYAQSPEYREFWDALRAGEFKSAQFKRFGKDGREIWIQASYNPIFDLNGKPWKVVKYASDITSAKQMEFKIAEKAKEDVKAAEQLQEKVNEILQVANKVAQCDYSQELTIRGEDAIGRLGAGLARFFADKRAAEVAEQERIDREREQSDDLARRVAMVLELVNSIAEGNFDIEFPNLGTDAVGQVAAALEQAVRSIRGVLIEVSEVADTVATAAEQLSEASQEIANGAQSQASSLEETASSMEEITSTVKQNTDNAQQARQLANGSRDVAEKGGEVVSNAVKAMDEINQSSKKIADIITTIDEIAFQTNLLALNAAVEAARAGEQGRGFAVVAAEVRNLAQRSASAAKEIKTLIEDSVGKVKNGTELVNKSGETLGEIVNSVKRVTDIVSEIAAASREQLAGVELVNKAVAQMDRITQGNASQTEEMSGTAASLLSHSVQMGELVSRFNLGNDMRRPSIRRSGGRSQGARDLSAANRPVREANLPSFEIDAGEHATTFEF